MLRLTSGQRAVLVDKLPDIANLVAGAVIIGFVLGEPAASWPVVIGSFAVWAGVIVFALVIAGDKP